MKRKFLRYTRSHFMLLMGAALLFASACSDPAVEPEVVEPIESGEVTTQEVNQWIVDSMRRYYYYNTSIPVNSQLNFNSPAQTFFSSLLDGNDRFSWMQDAEELQENLSGVSKTAGLGVGLALWDSGSRSVIASVRYVLKGSPADLAGVKRGDLFFAVNGTNMVASSTGSVSAAAPLFSGDPFTISLVKFNGTSFTADKDVTLTPVEGFQEQAIHLDTVLTTTSGKKVGYLFYNRFLNAQPNELVAAFGRFKTAGVEDLVLDLRYNGGGGIWVSAILAGLIQKDFSESETFIQYKYNANFRDENASYNDLFGGDANVINAIKANNLNLPRLYVIATGSTASASELIINNLRPFLSNNNVIHIGRTTTGKNEGSFSIVDRRTPKRITWGLQPIVVRIANRSGFGDYPDGLVPQHDINELNVAYLPWVPIGSFEDPLLLRALTLIDPGMEAVANRIMSAKLRNTSDRTLAEPSGYRDLLNPVRPVDMGDSFREHLQNKH